MNPLPTETRDLEIRSFREADEGAVVKLWLEAFPGDPPWNEPVKVVRRKLGVQRDLFLVGEYRGLIVAAVVAGFDGFRGWVYHLAVESTDRRRGFGRAMMVAAEARLRELGCPKINLQVRTSNVEVIQFYRGLGYTVEERVSMSKRLE